MSLASLLKESAPVLSTILHLAPGTSTAMNIIDLVGRVFGGSTEDQVAANVAADPEAAVKLKQLENENAENILQGRLQEQAQEIAAKQATRAWLSAPWQKGMVLGSILYAVILFTVIVVICLTTTVDLNAQEITLISLTGGPAIKAIEKFINLLSNK